MNAPTEPSDSSAPSPELSRRLARIALESLIRQLPKDQAPVDTDSVRAIEVMLRTAAHRSAWVSNKDAERLASEIVPALERFEAAKKDPRHPGAGDEQGVLALFRQCAIVSALAGLLAWNPDTDKWSPDTRKELDATRAEARKTLPELGRTLVDQTAVLYSDADCRVHPFFLHELIVALQCLESEPWKTGVDEDEKASGDAARLVSDINEQVDESARRVEDELEKLLANHQLGLDNAGDSVALAFAAAAIAPTEAGSGGSTRYTRAGLKACLGSYRESMGWEQGRVVCRDEESSPAQRLVVPAAEVYGAVAKAARVSRDENTFLEPGGEDAAPEDVLDLLGGGLRLADDSKVDGSMPKGWAADQILDSEEVEIWATAAVLDLALEADELRHRRDRQSVLEALDAKPAWGEDWPSWLEWDDYRDTSDPELGTRPGILGFIDSEIVAPRRVEPGQTQSKPVIALLFGPPGTTKTTIARAVAGGLQWPLVTLSPGNFIEEGLERVEARAGVIFDQLERLSRAVVIFDECDELFRKRAPQPATEPFRNVSAFITASMLPKLQDLHDRGRIVAFICTNFLDSIDPAMRRIGRIDHLIAVPPPNEAQRLQTIKQELNLGEGEESSHLLVAAERLAKVTDNFIRGEVVNAARELRRAGPYKSAKEAKDVAKRIGERRTTINPASQEFLDFKNDQKELSEPHRRGEDDE